MHSKFILLMSLSFTGLFSSAPVEACPCEDKQIVAILLNTDQAANTLSSEAASRLQNADARAFAQNELALHTKDYETLAKLSIDTGIPPEATDLSRAVLTRANEHLTKLADAKSSEVDRIYIDARVSELQLEVTALETYWIPKAKNPKLKAFLVRLLPNVVQEFETAQVIQKSLSQRK